MNKVNAKEFDTPESRDAKRLEALPMLLALELIDFENWSQPEDLLSHDELEQNIVEKLNLECKASYAELYEAINEQMCEWRWRWFTYNSGLEQFYARPEQWPRANLVTLWGRRKVLQANEYFPNDLSDIAYGLWETELADLCPQSDANDVVTGINQSETDEVIVNKFLENHLIEHRYQG